MQGTSTFWCLSPTAGQKKPWLVIRLSCAVGFVHGLGQITFFLLPRPLVLTYIFVLFLRSNFLLCDFSVLTLE